MCLACGGEEEINSHVMVCSEYENLRQDRDLSNNNDLVYYFRKVISSHIFEMGSSLYTVKYQYDIGLHFLIKN